MTWLRIFVVFFVDFSWVYLQGYISTVTFAFIYLHVSYWTFLFVSISWLTPAKIRKMYAKKAKF